LEKPQNPDRSDTVNSPPPAVDANGASPPPATGPANDGAEPAPPLTPAAWLAQNSIYLVIFGAVVAFIIHRDGLIGLWQWFIVALGLGFVVFIHELGHFVTAKWCDVHVQTFSLGFGPALPGCSFKYGETLYKIALFPLGGYVGMVGEGADADEDENYPRSFKNKTVGQRMLIISAGVIMNLIFGCLAFVLVYRVHGIERQTMDIAGTEVGGQVWMNGGRSGSRVTKIGKSVRLPFTSDYVRDPFFDELKIHVALSGPSTELAFSTKKIAPEGGDFDGALRPRSDKNDSAPVIGVAPAPQLVLLSQRGKSFRAVPVLYNSAAAAARVIDAGAGATVVAATDDSDPEQVTAVSDGWSEVGRRLRKLRGKSVVVRVRPKGAAPDSEPIEIKIKAEAPGFQWDDVIVGMTNPEQGAAFDPFDVKALAVDRDNHQQQTYSYFEYNRRLKQLEGKPLVIQVRRQGAGAKPVDVFVPPEYHRSLGLRMRMGEVAAVRNNSPAAEAGLRPGDVITAVTMTVVKPGAAGPGSTVNHLQLDDPLRLPHELYRLAAAEEGVKTVSLTVDRPNPPGKAQDGGEGNDDEQHKANKTVTVGPMEWDDTWTFNTEFPSASMAAISVAPLGIAYRVDSTVVSVVKDSPADKADLRPNDEIVEIAFRQTTKDPASVKWQDWFKLAATRGDQKRYDRWAYIDYFLQGHDYADVQLKVRRNGQDKDIRIPESKEEWLTAEEELDWPLAERGLFLSPDKRLQKADTIWDALQFGVGRTGEFILTIYQFLHSLATGRMSADNIQGPVGIAGAAFAAAEDPYEFILLMALISVNLAVVNFLPIPILDGGHMVFLIYEKLRGKPASETVRAVATYAGLALILGLMAFLLWREAVLPLIKWWWR
jgi:membrane-associated protease RseP (regulator of RpoE activity)